MVKCPVASLGVTSLYRLDTCHIDLQRIAYELIKEFDFTVCCGHRNQADQEKAFSEGKSRAHFPDSKHNLTPSRAMDILPYDAEKRTLIFDETKILDMLERVGRIAEELNIKIRLGRDFKSLGDKNHVELA